MKSPGISGLEIWRAANLLIRQMAIFLDRRDLLQVGQDIFAHRVQMLSPTRYRQLNGAASRV
jgi:hypothetical protein